MSKPLVLNGTAGKIELLLHTENEVVLEVSAKEPTQLLCSQLTANNAAPADA
jgi:hypothetical protein